MPNIFRFTYRKQGQRRSMACTAILILAFYQEVLIPIEFKNVCEIRAMLPIERERKAMTETFYFFYFFYQHFINEDSSFQKI